MTKPKNASPANPDSHHTLCKIIIALIIAVVFVFGAEAEEKTKTIMK